ncbi:unnamed protein product, partial [Aphanomyces euteiches]
FDMWASGIVVVIGGQYFSWNAGLEAGTLSYGIALALMALAYLCLVLSMAEMTSMMPFAGGTYAVVSFGLVVVFCLGSLVYVDLNQPGQTDFVAVGGFGTFMKASPISAVVENPKAIVPKGQITSMITLIATGVWIYIVCIFLPPGMPTLVDELAPLNRGYSRMFNMSNETATLLAVPATFATAQGFMLSYANIISAMANSRLFPRELTKRHMVYKTPVNSLVCGSVISFGLCFLVYYSSLNGVMYNACVIFAFLAYISQCYGYIQLKRRHGSMPRLFHSPVGVYGAVFAILIWIMNLIRIVGFQGDDEVSLSISVGLMLIFSIYYHTYAKTRQTFSEEEEKIMLVVHVANTGTSKKGSMTEAEQARRLHQNHRVP